MNDDSNGNGGGGRPEFVDHPAHAEIARWLLLSCVEYDHASNDTLAVLAGAHAMFGVADAIHEAMLQTAALAARGDEDD